ncbi:hypothetical protein AN2V17_01670 [Vallitalea sp. AN17-2]|uniref:Uncharacterized protein n=1 Tax=Vallitalea maricola TaxID=3074433 RepID=A0ACB5UEB1_9FIRM|nr:hypothetical protein AN2V17_01670 [Vallitalea sp. AN17-2]
MFITKKLRVLYKKQKVDKGIVYKYNKSNKTLILLVNEFEYLWINNFMDQFLLQLSKRISFNGTGLLYRFF